MICTLVLAGIAALVGGALVLLRDDDEPFVVYHYRSMCADPQGFEQGAARSEAAPHPVFVYGPWDVREEHPEMFDRTELDVWDPTEPGKVQLVACVDDVGRGEFVKRCEYTADFGDYFVNLYKTNYRVTLYEARTGKRVASSEFAGNRFGLSEEPTADPCSLTTSVPEDGPRSIDREGGAYIRQIRDALAPHVMH
ncbi:hypothetical protein OG909_09710 [Streptomyces sp. NBC_01754]|uniref:hypothetical protein n=1 Tax=Streptomyces sp. NBC_01754 TaxID=2975930 RepID=UPI002DD7F5D3|nr:hypothetical protein [Streptomyces sp. NBC_01754]WSC92548.1 hypothetical protein OG909_09710 [Streptomyces sp. NBC_01754]